jgi:hypothetical protein
MSAPPDESNLKYGWLGRTKFEQDKARQEKHANSSPWPKEIWHAATAAYLAGELEQERRFPVIITGLTGPFSTRQKLQQITGLPSLPEVQWATVTSMYDDDEEDHEVVKEGETTGTTTTDAQITLKQKKKKQKEEEPEKVQYCHVNWEQLERVKEYSDGEKVIVWFQEKRRSAWLARSVKRKGKGEGNREGEGQGQGGKHQHQHQHQHQHEHHVGHGEGVEGRVQ